MFRPTDEQQTKTLSEALWDQFLYGSCSLKESSSDVREKFIEVGFARYKWKARIEVVIDEPLPILAAAHWLNQRAAFTLLEGLRHNIARHSPRKNGFEAYLAVHLRKVFETPQKLNEVFTFRSDFASRDNLSWQRDDFELVTVTTSLGRRQISPVTPSSGPSCNFGLRGGINELLEWLTTNEGLYTYFFPPEKFGADILWFLRHIRTGELLLALAQCKHYTDTISNDVLVKGVRSVTPSWFWKSKDVHVCLCWHHSLVSLF
jgi:hypothetical protein